MPQPHATIIGAGIVGVSSAAFLQRAGYRVTLIDRLPPGEGTGSFATLIETLKKTGFDGHLTMEIGFNRRDVDPDAFAKRAYDYVKRLIET